MRVKLMKAEIVLPEGITANVENSFLIVKGAKGELKKDFKNPRVKIQTTDGKIVITAEEATKREKTQIGCFKAHIKNMLKGVTEGHVYKLKICSGHFPMNVSINGNEFIIKNFLGEKVPRVLKIKENATVKIEGTEVTVESIDKERAGQVAADIEKLSAITNRDLRIFQDGVYIVNKDGKELC